MVYKTLTNNRYFATAKEFRQQIDKFFEATVTKRGPTSLLQKQIEQISLMPRGKQKFINEMLDALIKQQQSA